MSESTIRVLVDESLRANLRHAHTSPPLAEPAAPAPSRYGYGCVDWYIYEPAGDAAAQSALHAPAPA